MSNNQEFSKSLKAVFLLPGLPHIVQKTNLNPGYAKLKTAGEALGNRLNELGIKRVVYFSTGWIAVLGQMLQAKEKLAGKHVDENWYQYGNLDYSVRVDVGFANKLAQSIKAGGRAVQLVNFEGFPIDTGTIVSHALLGGGRFASNVIANHVYSDFAATKEIAQCLRKEIDKDPTPTAVVGISGLSGRYFTEEIDLREDRFGDKADDEWNKRMLALLENGKGGEAEKIVGEYAQATKADMGFKILAFLNGVSGAPRKAKVHAYAPVYGTGQAVVEF